MAYRTHPASSATADSTLNDLESYARSLAEAALGLSADRMLWRFQPVGFAGEAGAGFNNSGGGARSGTAAAQALRLTSGVGGTAEVIAGPSSAANAPRPFVAGAGKKIWFAAYFSLGSTTIAATEEIGVGGSDLATGILVSAGTRGTSSTTNFIAYGNAGAGGFIDSGVALDTSKHLHQFWRDGTTGNYKIDSNAVVQGDVRNGSNTALEIFVRASASTRTADFVWFAGAAELE